MLLILINCIPYAWYETLSINPTMCALKLNLRMLLGINLTRTIHRLITWRSLFYHSQVLYPSSWSVQTQRLMAMLWQCSVTAPALLRQQWHSSARTVHWLSDPWPSIFCCFVEISSDWEKWIWKFIGAHALIERVHWVGSEMSKFGEEIMFSTVIWNTWVIFYFKRHGRLEYSKSLFTFHDRYLR